MTGPASRSRSHRLRTLLLLVLLLAALLALARWREGHATLVARVLDGDTLVLATGERVRLIGINAPEIAGLRRLVPQPFGPEAAAFARRLAEGRRVRLEFDRERRDKYGRTLAYVFAGDFDLNAAMIREGYAVAYRQFPHRRYDEFLTLEAEARRARRGLWGESQGPSP